MNLKKRIDSLLDFPSRSSWSLMAVFYSIVFWVTLSPFWRMTKELRWDGIDYYLPLGKMTIDAFREGRYPLWEPSLNCGLPLHAGPDLSTLNPLLRLLSLTSMNSALAFIVFFLLHWWIAGLGAMWFSRILGAKPLGGLIAAFSFALSGFFIGHAQHTPILISGALFPFILGFCELAVKEKRWGLFFPAAFFFGCSCVGGYPPLTAFSGLAAFLWLILRYPKNWKLILLGMSMIGVSAAVIYLPVLHAFKVEGVLHTNRFSALDPKIAIFANPFSFRAFFSLFLPQIIFFIPDMGGDLSIVDGYLGCLAIPLMVVWWKKLTPHNRDEQKPWAMVIFTIFMFLTSLGGVGGVRYLLYYLFPPMQFVRYNGIFRVYWIFAIAVYAGVGFSQLEFNEKFRDLFRRYGYLTLAVIALFIGHQIYFHYTFLRLSVYLPALIVFPLALWAIYSRKFTQNSILLILAALFVGDMVGHVKQNGGALWDSPNHIHGFAAPSVSSVIRGEPPARTALVQYVNMEESDYQEHVGRFGYGSVLAAPFRFWLAPNAQRFSSRDQVVADLDRSSVIRPLSIYIQDETELVPFANNIVTPGEYGSAKVTLYSPEKVEVEVSVPRDRPAVLASSERSSAGWRVSIDGKEAPSLVMNLYFRATVVPPGTHHLIWTYEPSGWPVLLVASQKMLALLALLSLIVLLKRWRKNELS